MLLKNSWKFVLSRLQIFRSPGRHWSDRWRWTVISVFNR